MSGKEATSHLLKQVQHVEGLLKVEQVLVKGVRHAPLTSTSAFSRSLCLGLPAKALLSSTYRDEST